MALWCASGANQIDNTVETEADKQLPGSFLTSVDQWESPPRHDMTRLDASSVAALLREFGQRSALRGGNPFRANAYARAAGNLVALSLPLNQMIAQDRLLEIPGVGDAIADIVKTIHATGSHPALEKMRNEIPASVLEMLNIPGLRADKVLKLYKELGLSSLAGLEEAARGGRLKKIKGLGASAP
jgi:DNA polymerase (family 10)